MTDNSDKILRSQPRLDYKKLHNTGEFAVKEGSESDCFKSVSSSPAHSSGDGDSADVSLDDADLNNVLSNNPFSDDDISDVKSRLNRINVRSNGSAETVDYAQSLSNTSSRIPYRQKKVGIKKVGKKIGESKNSRQ